jgi:hypothetical protein
MFLIALALMLFAGATLLDATASRVLVLLVAIVLTAATLLPTMLTSLATMLLAQRRAGDGRPMFLEVGHAGCGARRIRPRCGL